MSLYFTKRAKPVLKWQLSLLLVFATKWIKRLKIRKGAAAEASSWWFFVHNWYSIVKKALSAFIKGDYHFQPMITYTFDKQKIIVWDYCDRLIVKLIYKIIKPLFKYIISPTNEYIIFVFDNIILNIDVKYTTSIIDLSTFIKLAIVLHNKGIIYL